ncbi:MAG TPA: hypothetical protein VKM55_18445 [Candidatus Lokiarchaeia archaeon]|nr:hypothetical protein [Candidatus Lokiarchaeia archaeon]
MSVIQYSTYFLILTLDIQDEKVKKHFKLIRDELERARSMIDDILSRLKS